MKIKMKNMLEKATLHPSKLTYETLQRSLKDSECLGRVIVFTDSSFVFPLHCWKICFSSFSKVRKLGYCF